MQRNLAASCSFSFLDLTALLDTAVQRNLAAASEALGGGGCASRLAGGVRGEGRCRGRAHEEGVLAAARAGQPGCACVQRLLQALLCLKRAGLVMRVLREDMAAWAEHVDADVEGPSQAGLAQRPCGGGFASFAEGVDVCRRGLSAIEACLWTVGQHL